MPAITLYATSPQHARSIPRDDLFPRAYAYINSATRWIQLVVATLDLRSCDAEEKPCFGPCRCGRNALGGTSACWAQGTSGPVLGGDRCRCVERERCDGGGRLAEHWCPVVPQGWRHAISQ